jgi:para-aminobenzoate synthetase component I
MPSIPLGSIADPAAAFRRISAEPGAVWLDGGEDELTSFIACSPAARLSVGWDGRVKLAENGTDCALAGPPLLRIEEFVERSTFAPLGSSAPRVVGFFSYDLAPLVEPAIPSRQTGAPSAPLVSLARYDAVLVLRRDFRAGPGAYEATVEACDPVAGARLRRALDAADRPPALRGGELPARARVVEMPDRDDYVAAVRRAQRYIAAGDVYQVNLARRLTVETAAPPGEVYLRLRAEQPVPLGCFLDCGDLTILSNSPERFLRVRGAAVETEPIKGTRPCAGDPVVDAAERESLQRDPKERAEHVMIVDLERNDLGRICTTGSVSVPSLMRVESYATLHHLVSTVRGRLRDSVGLAEILGATFPGGSVTGAPKIRAAQIIAELEPTPRGVYTGAIAWFRGPRDFDSAIAIRTAVCRGRLLAHHVGAGIVADSDPAREYEECLLKARPFLAATGAGA